MLDSPFLSLRQALAYICISVKIIGCGWRKGTLTIARTLQADWANGVGEFDGERNPDRDAEELEKLELIRSMQAEGKSCAQIAELLGYKSKTAIMNMHRKADA